MSEYIEVLLRSVITFVGLLCLALLMGRKQLSQITFFDYVVGIMIGSIAAVIVVDRTASVIDGEPKVVIQNGIIINKNMLKEKYNIGDLLMQLRDKGVFDITEVDFAILEPNGKLSILKKPQHNTITRKDINIAADYKGIMTELIIDGRIITKHLEIIGKDAGWLQDQLNSSHVNSIENVVFAGYQTDGQLYISLRNDSTGIHLV